MTDTPHTQEVRPVRVHKTARTVWVSIEYISYRFAEACMQNMRIIQKEIDLFLGAALFLIGLFSFSTGKYCDGNTADYLSCTRPTAYYYYGGWQIALIVFGAMLVLVWYIKNRQSK